MQAITAGQYYLVYNSLSFTIATFATATLFFWFGRSQCSANYRTAVTITGLVTFIALYQGYHAAPTPEGVARATTRTVVLGSLMVLWLDFLLTALMFS